MKRHAYIFIATLGGCLVGPLEASDAEIQAGRSHELFEQLHKFKDTYQDLREHYVEFIQQQINVFDEVLREAKNIETSKIESKKLQEFSLLQGKELLSEEEELNVRSQIMELNLTLLVIKELILNISLGKNNLKRRLMPSTLHMILFRLS